jgi:hypothetical protein
MAYYPQEFWDVVERIKKAYPTSAPIRVRTVDASELVKAHGCECFGDYMTYERKGKVAYYLVRIARGLDLDSAIECFLHEASHCLDVDTKRCNPRDHHRDSWGQWYAKCYRVING